MPAVPKDKQENGKGQTGATSHCCQVPMAPSGDGLCRPHLPSFTKWQSVHPDDQRLLHEIHLGKGSAYQGGCRSCFSSEGGMHTNDHVHYICTLYTCTCNWPPSHTLYQYMLTSKTLFLYSFSSSLASQQSSLQTRAESFAISSTNSSQRSLA